MLYNVLIVDDEMMIRKGLRLAVPWGQYGFQVVEEAENAEQAIEKLENTHIDFALVDIQMPGINGIEFITYLREAFPHIQTMVITGHSDFEYLVSALKLGVSDYLLKPAGREQLVAAIETVRKKLDAKAERRQRAMAHETATGRLLTLRLLGKGFSNREELLAFCDRHDIATPLADYCVLAVSFGKLSGLVAEWFDGNRGELEEALDWGLEQQGKPKNIFAALVGNYYAVLAPSAQADELLPRLLAEAQKVDPSARVGVGPVYSDFFYMEVSFLQAVEALHSGGTDKPVALYSELKQARTAESRQNYYNSLIIQKLEEGHYAELDSILERIFSETLQPEVNSLANWCINSIYSIAGYFNLESLEDCSDILDFDITTLSSLYFFNTIRETYREKLERISRVLERVKGSSTKSVVQEVYKIVQAEYANPELSLQSIAARLNISYNYLSTVFKQVSGKSFSAYLTGVKMDHARRLLLAGGHKVYEIAEQVGYTSSRYFTEQFRSAFGVSPSEYRAHSRDDGAGHAATKTN